MPKATLEKLPYDKTKVKSNAIIVRAFDGSKRELPAYSCLLGRPWTHASGAVLSSLHQKIKFIVDNKLVIISREEDLSVSYPQSTEHIEAVEEALKMAFQSLEISNTTLAKDELRKGKVLRPMMVAARMMIKKGFRVGQGLGKNLHGISKPIELRGNSGRKGLGYWPKISCMKPYRQYRKGTTNLYKNFISKRYANQVEEAATEENSPKSFVRPCSSQEETNNWTIQEVPMTYVLKSPKEQIKANDISSSQHHLNNLVNQSNGEGTSQEPPSELKWLIELEDQIILPHQEETETINIGFKGEVKEVKVGRAMCSDDRNELIQLLTEYVDIFALSYRDMPRLDNEIEEHKIPLEPSCPPIKQKLRRMNPETSLKIKEEVKKQLEVRFLTVAKYP
ncbi:hypothetical protein CR513_09262, partial [Mucuna pruriens]